MNCQKVKKKKRCTVYVKSIDISPVISKGKEINIIKGVDIDPVYTGFKMVAIGPVCIIVKKVRNRFSLNCSQIVRQTDFIRESKR